MGNFVPLRLPSLLVVDEREDEEKGEKKLNSSIAFAPLLVLLQTSQIAVVEALRHSSFFFLLIKTYF